MPYDLFKHHYSQDDEKPAKGDTIKAVVQEFRARYREMYPTHSPDELGNFVNVCKILGSYRKKGVTVEHMRSSIDTFYAKSLDRTKPEYPAWRKWLWCVVDTRPKDDSQFAIQQRDSRAEPKKIVRQRPKDRSAEYRQRLESARLLLEEALVDEELFVANNGQDALTNLKSDVKYWEVRVEKEGS